MPTTNDQRRTQGPYRTAHHAHALLLLTEWPEYRELDWVRLHDHMDVPVIINGRNLLDPRAVQHLGFEYLCMSS